MNSYDEQRFEMVRICAAFGIAAPLLADLQRLILTYTAAVDSPRNAQIQLKSVNEAIPAGEA